MSLAPSRVQWKLSPSRKHWLLHQNDQEIAQLDYTLFGKRPWLKYHTVQFDELVLDEWYYRAALNYCMRLLARKSYSTGQFQEKLSIRSVPSVIQDKVLEKLKELGYLADASFAKRLAEYWSEKGLSRQAIKQKLLMRKFSKEHIDEAASGLSDVNQVQRAIDKFTQNIDSDTFYKKVVPKLLRKGFCYEDIKRSWEASNGCR